MNVMAQDESARPCGHPIRRRSADNPIGGCLGQSDLLEDVDLLDLQAIPYREAVYRPGGVVHAMGAPSDHIFLVLKGVGTVYHDLLDGSRQVIDLLLPGDIHGMETMLGNRPTHSVSAGTVLCLAIVERGALAEIIDRHPRVMASLFWASLRREQVLRGHIMAIGKRNAKIRLAHFLCVMQGRQARFDPAGGHCTRINLTQCILADAIGLTSVHVGRVLRQISCDRLIRLERGMVVILDLPRLREIAEYADPGAGAA